MSFAAGAWGSVARYCVHAIAVRYFLGAGQVSGACASACVLACLLAYPPGCQYLGLPRHGQLPVQQFLWVRHRLLVTPSSLSQDAVTRSVSQPTIQLARHLASKRQTLTPESGCPFADISGARGVPPRRALRCAPLLRPRASAPLEGAALRHVGFEAQWSPRSMAAATSAWLGGSVANSYAQWRSHYVRSFKGVAACVPVSFSLFACATSFLVRPCFADALQQDSM